MLESDILNVCIWWENLNRFMNIIITLLVKMTDEYQWVYHFLGKLIH